MSEELAQAVREILDEVPCSDMELAQRADVPQSTISRIRTAKRGCTREVAQKLAQALDGWAEDCTAARDHLHRALEAEED